MTTRALRRSPRAWAWALPLALIAIGASGCGSSDHAATATTGQPAPTATKPSQAAPASTPSHSSKAGAAKVTIDNFAYSPATLHVKAGAKVTFVNHDTSNHTATGPGALHTGNLTAGGGTKTVTLSKPGTYRYTCDYHPFMHGTIVVK